MRRFLIVLLLASGAAVTAPGFTPEPSDDDVTSAPVPATSGPATEMLEARRKVFEQRDKRQTNLVNDMGASSYNRRKAIRAAERSGGMVGSRPRHRAGESSDEYDPVGTVMGIVLIGFVAGTIVWMRMHSRAAARAAAEKARQKNVRVSKSRTDFRLIR